MSTLLLRLAGPLQSWGSDSKFDERKTDYLPTKSGVIGLLAAALGRSREDNLSDLVQLKFGVRVDHGGTILKDFQVTNMAPYKPNISRRYYLSDAIFLAGFESDDAEFLEAIADALGHPVFPLFLGRRSCPPTLPLLLGIREKPLYEALYDEPWLLPAWCQKKVKGQASLRIVTDSGKPNAAIKKDLPLSFSGFRRQYTYRAIEEKEPRQFGETAIEHDPMKELES